jgi:Ca2+-binding EF-hand superfamily protein
MDKTKSGKITFREFLIWLSDVSRGDTLEKLQWTFKLYDVNEDGLLTRGDIVCIIRSVFLLMGKRREADDEELIHSKVDAFFQVRNLFDK